MGSTLVKHSSFPLPQSPLKPQGCELGLSEHYSSYNSSLHSAMPFRTRARVEGPERCCTTVRCSASRTAGPESCSSWLVTNSAGAFGCAGRSRCCASAAGACYNLLGCISEIMVSACVVDKAGLCSLLSCSAPRALLCLCGLASFQTSPSAAKSYF